jgi:hypothetical protein
MEKDTPPSYGIVANAVADKVFRRGAKVLILWCNGDAECPYVNGLSVGGRRITKYTHYKKLTNFRAAWIPEQIRETVGWRWEDKAKAEEMAAALNKRWGKPPS